ncbi:hypothetical protein [Flavobacterium suzhouense]|uniref:Uncharacterized protein n=1 Tax=Flavobacterium suzhouense TaxID=1529638 RepID=A0ABW5NMY8_9FLAO
MDNYNTELEKLISILNRDTKKDNIANILLFRDYLSKLFAWKKKLGDTSEFIKTKEAHNLFLNINSEWTAKLESLEEFNSKLIANNIPVKSGRYFNDIFIYLYFQWNLNSDRTEINECELANPYQPAIKIIERCKDIHTHNGQFEIGKYTYNNREKYKNFTLPSLEDDFLDYIDNKLNHLGTSGIPNQQETNKLWEEFQKLKQ